MLKSFCLFLIITTIQVSFGQNKISKSNTEWKQNLTKEQYYILREKGTERAFTGKYNKFYKSGIYHCAGCNTPLFSSKNKFDSGTGWPSFDTAIDNRVKEIADYKYGRVRAEIICATCEGHLGHVFNDGPRQTTGRRYCVNSLSLQFDPKTD